MRILTKHDLLEGTNKRVNFFVKDYDGEIIIRPLNDREVSRIFASIGPLSLSEDDKTDLQSIDLDKNFEALRLATVMGLVEPKLTMEEVANLKFGIPELIGTKVLELSGVSTEELIMKKKKK
jgi:bifunctional DNA-binding transcriptional regulator/antitoxin component of YhaV-PrlF toxin-antitoxin module